MMRRKLPFLHPQNPHDLLGPITGQQLSRSFWSIDFGSRNIFPVWNQTKQRGKTSTNLSTDLDQSKQTIGMRTPPVRWPQNHQGQSSVYSTQRCFLRLAANINIAAGTATCQTLCRSPRWVLVLSRTSHANRQFRAAVRLYMSFWDGSKCCGFLLAPQGPLKPALKVGEVGAQSVDLCWSLSMHLKAPAARAV